MKKYYLILATVMITSALVGAVATGRIYRTLDQEILSDQTLGEGSALTAIKINETGLFGDPVKGYYGLLPRGPIYPMLLAGLFLFLGQHIFVIWVFNALLYFAALLFFFEISKKLLALPAAFFPPLMLALFWGGTINIFVIQMEALALLLLALLLSLIFDFLETTRGRSLLHAAAVFAALILTKPISLYFLPIALVLLIFTHRTFWKYIAAFGAITYIIVSIWQFHNWYAVGTPELGRGGHIFLTRASSAEWHGEQLKGFVLSAFVGDYITGYFYPTHPEAPEPRTTVNRILNRWYGDYRDAGSEIEINERFWEEGKSIAFAHPVQFLAVTPVWLMRYNNPVGLNINDLDHMFVNTHPELPSTAKIAIILGIRVIWYSFLGVVVWQVIRQIRLLTKNPKAHACWLWVVALVVYFNAIHALATFAHHRYVLPVLIFYYIFFTDFLSRHILQIIPHRYAARLRKKIS